MRLPPTIQFFTISLVALVLGSCGVISGPLPRQRAQRILHQWNDDQGAGRVAIRISLADQIAEFTRGGRDIGWCYVATGKEGHSTRDGTYRITEKIEDKHSNVYGWLEDEFGNVTDGDAKASERVPAGMVYVPAPMPFWMRLTSYGIGMHGGLIPEPGKPASHGCIRMPKEFVPLLFDAVVVGTPVVITHAPSKHGPRVIETRPVSPGFPVASTPLRVGSVDSVAYRDGVPVSDR
jgi:lipoprotein-anchoring transpeptidase ErfK/SrfK